MTTPRDAIGLSERLRDALVDDPNYGKCLRMSLSYEDVSEAATQLDTLQERVKELEAKNERLLQTMVPVSKDGNYVFLDGLGDVEIDHDGALRSRATRAEQERDEAQRDAERYRFLRGRDLDTIHKGGVFAGMTPQNIILNEDDLDREVDAAIRRLAGPDKEKRE